MRVKCSAPLWNGTLQFTQRDSGGRISARGQFRSCAQGQNALLNRAS
jgi:hypothetical protein